jgi:hypothetical protein
MKADRADHHQANATPFSSSKPELITSRPTLPCSSKTEPIIARPHTAC